MTDSSTLPRVVTFHFTLKDDSGEILETSRGEDPMSLLTGQNQILPKLEETLLSMMIGQSKTVTLNPEDGYGERNPDLVLEVDAEELSHLDLDIGTLLQLRLGDDSRVVQVTKLTPEKVTLDGNHPLAGMRLTFEIELIDSRQATPEEVAHGHARGWGGVQH